MARKPTPGAAFETRLAKRQFSDTELKTLAKRLADIDKMDGAWVDDIFVLGTVNPDAINGTFTVEPTKLGTVIDALSGLGRPNIEVFPLGIIATDGFRVQVNVNGRR
jgi:hypothetical protein